MPIRFSKLNFCSANLILLAVASSFELLQNSMQLSFFLAVLGDCFRGYCVYTAISPLFSALSSFLRADLLEEVLPPFYMWWGLLDPSRFSDSLSQFVMLLLLGLFMNSSIFLALNEPVYSSYPFAFSASDGYRTLLGKSDLFLSFISANLLLPRTCIYYLRMYRDSSRSYCVSSLSKRFSMIGAIKLPIPSVRLARSTPDAPAEFYLDAAPYLLTFSNMTGLLLEVDDCVGTRGEEMRVWAFICCISIMLGCSFLV